MQDVTWTDNQGLLVKWRVEVLGKKGGVEGAGKGEGKEHKNPTKCGSHCVCWDKGSGKCWRSSGNIAKSWWSQKIFFKYFFYFAFPVKVLYNFYFKRKPSISRI